MSNGDIKSRIEKGKWVGGKYVDKNGVEILTTSPDKPEFDKGDIDYNKSLEESYPYFSKLLKKVFTVPVLTMIGVWIIVYYQITSHEHYYKRNGTYKNISGSVSGKVSVDNYRPLEVRVVR
jgi:hypothetical protein